MEKLSFNLCVVATAAPSLEENVSLLWRCNSPSVHVLGYITESDGVSLRPHLMTSSDRGSRSHRATDPRSRSQPRASRCSGAGRCRWQSRRWPPSPGCPGHWCLNKVIIRAAQHSAHHVASLIHCLLYIAVYNVCDVCDVVLALAFCLSDNIQCCLILTPPSVEWIGRSLQDYRAADCSAGGLRLLSTAITTF